VKNVLFYFSTSGLKKRTTAMPYRRCLFCSFVGDRFRLACKSIEDLIRYSLIHLFPHGISLSFYFYQEKQHVMWPSLSPTKTLNSPRQTQSLPKINKSLNMHIEAKASPASSCFASKLDPMSGSLTDSAELPLTVSET